jgi:hypothetical protein
VPHPRSDVTKPFHRHNFHLHLKTLSDIQMSGMIKTLSFISFSVAVYFGLLATVSTESVLFETLEEDWVGYQSNGQGQ